MDDDVTPGTRQAECDRAPNISTRADQRLTSLNTILATLREAVARSLTDPNVQKRLVDIGATAES
jgi:hypothetical protein